MTESAYLVGLRLTGKKVVVVGGGTVAQRRLPLLIASGADVHVISRSATRSVEAMTGITLALREYRDGDLDGAWYAIAATDDPRVNEAVVAEAASRQIFCVRADIAVEGTAVTPASFSYAGLSVGVLAGGEHRRSAAIRSAIREALQTGVITPEGPVGSDAVKGGVALIGGRSRRPRTDHRARAPAARPGRRRGRRPPRAAGTARRTAPTRGSHRRRQDPVRAGDGPGRHQRRDDRTRPGRKLRGAPQRGDPFVFARGYEEVLACAEAGIPVTVVPGVTSAIGVPALAGVPVTHRAINHEFVVVSGHLPPGHPESLVNWDALAAMSGTIVLLMAVERIELFAEALLAGGRPADTPVLVVQHGTTAAQHTLRATLADTPEKIRAEGIRPPAIIVIGAVAAFGV